MTPPPVPSEIPEIMLPRKIETYVEQAHVEILPVLTTIVPDTTATASPTSKNNEPYKPQPRPEFFEAQFHALGPSPPAASGSGTTNKEPYEYMFRNGELVLPPAHMAQPRGMKLGIQLKDEGETQDKMGNRIYKGHPPENAPEPPEADMQTPTPTSARLTDNGPTPLHTNPNPQAPAQALVKQFINPPISQQKLLQTLNQLFGERVDEKGNIRWKVALRRNVWIVEAPRVMTGVSLSFSLVV
jgi:hypothetical protein